MRNPLRDESAAFRLVLLTLAAFGLIALGSWIDTWLGLAVFLVLLAGSVWALRGGARTRVTIQVAHTDDGVHRVLVVANETLAGTALLDLVRERVAGGEVLVVAPALNSRLRLWVSDEDGARSAARERLEESLGRLRAAGITARGEVGDADPLQAVEDAARTFAADEIVVSTHPPERSNWLENGVVERIRDRFGLPVTHVVVDLADREAAMPVI